MFKKFYKITILVLTSYAFLGFIVLPLVVKSQMIAQVAQASDAKISIESIYFNPFSFFVEVLGVELETKEGQKLLSLKSFSLNLQVSSLLASAIHVKEFRLIKPQVSLIYNQDKTLNFDALFKTANEIKKEDDNTSFHMPRVILDTVTIADGRVNYEDFTKKSPFDFSFEDIKFELKDIDTNDFNTSKGVVRFYSHLSDGGFIDFKSEAVGFQPLKVKGSLNIEAMKLYSSYKYIQDALNIEVADGKVSLSGAYDFNLDDINATTLSGVNVSLEGVRVRSKKSFQDILTLETFYLQDATLRPMLQNVRAKKIGIDSLYAKIQRETNAQIDWVEYIKVANMSSAEPAKEADARATTPWNVILEELALQKIKVDFVDKNVTPSVKTELKELNFYAKNLTLEGNEPFSYTLDMKLNRDANCSSLGSLKHKVFQLNSSLECRGLDVVHYAPYIDTFTKKEFKVYDLNLERLVAGFDANVSVNQSDSNLAMTLSEANLYLSNFALNKKSTKEQLASFSNFGLNGVDFDSQTQHVQVQKILLDGLNISAKRYKNGNLNIEDLVVLHANIPKATQKVKSKKEPISKKTKKETKEKEYTFLVGHVELRNSQATFDDKALSPSVKTKIDKMSFNAYDVDSKENSWLKYDLSSRVNSKGYVTSKGEVRHTPLKQKGSLNLQKISLKELTPYLQEMVYLNIDDGYLSLSTKTTYAKSSARADLKAVGSLKIEEFFLSDSRDKTPILAVNELKLNSLTYEMFPNRIFVDEANVNSFYLNALVDDKKTMNLSSLMKQKEDANVTQSASVKEVKTEKIAEQQTESFPLKIMKVNVAFGSADFSDLSLPIEFKTNIHDVNGVIYGISNTPDETSYIDINGEVDRYGSTKLKGSINAGNPKNFMDLDFSFQNLDLEAMSGYSASFAGHEIDSGKLFLNLGYDIMNSELLGENNIIIKNIKLGDEVKDENSSSLPLGFVISLLEDSDGVIDINMPVQGNVDAPDFKYGALVWRTFASLVLKAVASPFSILGSVLGVEGDKLEYAEFEGGSIKILPHEQEKLDNIAKLLMKKPKISLAIGGRYDTTVDKRAIQKEKLSALIMKEGGIKNKEDQLNSVNVDVLEDIYDDLAKEDKLDEIEDALKKQYKGEEFERAYASAVFEECVKLQVVTPDEMQLLAQKRAEMLKSYLIEKNSVNASRITTLNAAEVETAENKMVRNKLEVVVK